MPVWREAITEYMYDLHIRIVSRVCFLNLLSVAESPKKLAVLASLQNRYYVLL